MDTKQPEALRLAYTLDLLAMDMKTPRMAATELRRQHAEIETLRTGYSAARLEIESLKERVQQLGQLARDVNSRRGVELEAQLAAVGAGGVEPLRKRCLHQISEPAKAGWCDGCSPDNCGGCASSAAPVDADTGRLNWLERHSDGFYNLDRISAIVGKGFLTGPFTLGLQTNHATLREAIDAARAAQKGSQ